MVLDDDVAVDLSNLRVWCTELEEFTDEKADDFSGWITESEVLVGIADADVLVVADVVAKTLYLRATIKDYIIKNISKEITFAFFSSQYHEF